MNSESLLESKELRDQNITKDYVLDKVKALVLLPGDTYTTIEMVCEYYEVDYSVINSLINDHREELFSDGVDVLKGERLSSFKKECQIKSRASSLTIIPRRAILRIGMLLRDSEIAKQVRTYLLNIEENTDINIKMMSVINTIRNDMDSLKQYNGILVAENESMKTHIHNLISKVDELLNQPLFKLYENSSKGYETLMIEFTEIMRNKGLYHGNYGKDYSLFNKEFSKWTGIDFGNKILNKKDYWINFYGLDIIKHFIYGVKQGTIIKNNNGYWIDLNGIYSNKVEWQRTLNEFDNKCAYCDSEGGLVAEHINPQSKNNSTDCCYNIVPACMQCNKEKGNMIMKEWVKYKNFPKERMQKIRNHWNNYNF